MSRPSPTWNIISWIVGLIFIFLGIMNLIYIHHIPGLIYLVLFPFYLPPTNEWIRKTVGFTIPLIPKMVLAFFILWYTLAVGELVELFESYLGH